MGTILDDLYDVLFKPQAALARIAAEKKLVPAFVVFLISVLIPMWAVCLGLQATGTASPVGLLIIVQVIGSVVMWLVGTAVWHLCAELLGGKGSAVSLLSVLGFVHFPRIFIVPLWVIATRMPDAVITLFLTIGALVIGIWTLSLEVLAIRAAHQISRTKAVLVFLTPLLFMVAAGAITILFAGAALVQWPLELAG